MNAPVCRAGMKKHQGATRVEMTDYAEQPIQHLTQKQLAERWQVSRRTLERWRAGENGPLWIVLCGSIRYRLIDVQEFEDRNLAGSRVDAAPASEGGAE